MTHFNRKAYKTKTKLSVCWEAIGLNHLLTLNMKNTRIICNKVIAFSIILLNFTKTIYVIRNITLEF